MPRKPKSVCETKAYWAKINNYVETFRNLIEGMFREYPEDTDTEEKCLAKVIAILPAMKDDPLFKNVFPYAYKMGKADFEGKDFDCTMVFISENAESE